MNQPRNLDAAEGMHEGGTARKHRRDNARNPATQRMAAALILE